MANNCFYTMKVAGKKENVQKLYEILQYKHEDEYMLARIFSADGMEDSIKEDGTFVMNITGDCAWSVHSCMCDGPFTYHDVNPNHLTTIAHLTDVLQLDIECYSEEPGVGFAEHYHWVKGETLIAEEADYAEYYWDKDDYPTFKEFCDDYEIDSNEISESDFDEDGYCTIGGFDMTFEIDKVA